MRVKFLYAVVFLFSGPCYGQVGEYLGDEKAFYAATKQVNQFLHRFNGEENLLGVRYSKQDSSYRDQGLRNKYIKVLFDKKQKDISQESKNQFLAEVTDSDHPQYLDLHGGSWFAEVSTMFTYKGKDEKLQLFLQLQEEAIGSKWVIFKAFFDPFKEYFVVDTTDKKKFIHPMSHELDFMNLRKIFDDPEIVVAYTNKGFQPDYLSLLFFEIKQGNLKYKTVTQVKFHFFQLENWYFELSEFNRRGSNTGWLISNLLNVNTQQKDQLRKFIYYEGM